VTATTVSAAWREASSATTPARQAAGPRTTYRAVAGHVLGEPGQLVDGQVVAEQLLDAGEGMVAAAVGVVVGAKTRSAQLAAAGALDVVASGDGLVGVDRDDPWRL
jgi:hypothetical protein